MGHNTIRCKLYTHPGGDCRSSMNNGAGLWRLKQVKIEVKFTTKTETLKVSVGAELVPG